jgi:hypothetical protein
VLPLVGAALETRRAVSEQWSRPNSDDATRRNVNGLALAGHCDRNLSYCSPGPPSATIDLWTHLPALGRFTLYVYGLSNALLDRDGRVIGCNLPIGNGPLLEQAPAMAQILRELAAGVPVAHLRRRVARVLERIDAERVREPGEG